MVKCQQEYFNLFSDESTEKQFAMAFDSFFRFCFVFHLWVSLSSVVNIFRVHPQLLQITDFSITIYFDMYFYAISRQFVVRAQPKAAASAPKLLQLLPLLHPSFRLLPLLFSRFLQRGICIINCQQCHKIFSLVSFFYFTAVNVIIIVILFCF